MRNKTGFNPLSRTAAHQRAMSRNMVTSLFRFERITTTKAKRYDVKSTISAFNIGLDNSISFGVYVAL